MSITRKITIKARKYLDTPEVLLFIGPRQAGKTTILKQLKDELEKQAKTAYFINLEDSEYLDLLNKSPKNIFKILTLDLKQKSYIFIDEVQYLKNPSNFLKYLHDEYAGKIKILASGSSAFYLDEKFKDSLAGRKKIFNVSTLSFSEFLLFKGEEELSKLNFSKLSISEAQKISFYYREYVIFGGYPKVVLASLEEKEDVLREIAFSYVKKDIFEAKLKREDLFYKLFRILASQVGNLTNASELASTLGISKPAVDRYLYVMEKSFHVSLVRPFYKNIRKELTKMPKVYFHDLGLRNFFVDNFESFETREDKGALLENAVFRQLIEAHELERINFWRTTQQNEIDFVIEDKIAFEVKTNLTKFKKKKYEKFFQSYPKIELSLVTIDKKDDKVDEAPVFDVWEI